MALEKPQNSQYPLLDGINCPEDIQNMPIEELKSLADEIRACIIERVKENGGHLASNLGAVEATLAIHRVFSSPKDHIIFDVGHQSYTHKLLTGRREQFDTLRLGGGISGFPKRSESEHDAFGTGHSSTSLSAALGFAEADRLGGSDAYTVCMFGDGAFSGGMIHEALNNCRKDLRLVMILNDNEITNTQNMAAFFKTIGIPYYGPVDGNNVQIVEEFLNKAKATGKSCLVHLHTQKGKGYAPAEENPDRYHALHPAGATHPEGRSFSEEMGVILTEMAQNDNHICAITAAMTSGTGLSAFQSAHPERFFDVGIAEPHAVTFAAGLAANGYRPVVAIYSSFLQRAYDNIIHDVALQNLPVVFCIDRAGLNAADGPTHHGIFDVAFLSQISNISIYTPITYQALRSVLGEALASGKPAAIRYPNGYESEIIKNTFYSSTAVVSGRVRADYTKDEAEALDAIIITHGRITLEAIKAKAVLKEQGKNVGILLLEQIKPYDKIAAEVAELLPTNSCRVLFLEEEIRAGGMGMNLSATLASFKVMENKSITVKALNDHFAVQTENEPIWKSFGLDSATVVADILY